MIEHLLKHVLQHLWHAGAQAGSRKLSELTGRKAQQVEAAVAVAVKFMQAVQGGLISEAHSHCTEGLVKVLGSRGLREFFSGVELKSLSWNYQSADVSSEHNKWGTLFEVKLTGLLRGTAKGSPETPVEQLLVIQLFKLDNEWKVDGLIWI